MNFDLELKKKRPFWKEVVLCALYSLGLWAILQVGMNYKAYGMIVEYKMETVSQKIVERIEAAKQENLPTLSRQDIRRYPRMDQSSEQLKLYDDDHFVFRGQKLEKRNQFRSVFADMEVYPSDNRIVLPRISKNVPLVKVPNHQNWGQLENIIQKGLQNGVVIHPFSRTPGQLGNFFVTGHSSYYLTDPGKFKEVFALLHEVQVGDEVEVYWEGQKFVYEIEEEKIVTPMQVDVLDHPLDRSIITLMTCTPVGTNKKRLILVGQLKNTSAQPVVTASAQ